MLTGITKTTDNQSNDYLLLLNIQVGTEKNWNIHACNVTNVCSNFFCATL